MNNRLAISCCDDWRLIIDGANDGFYNMSADEALLHFVEEGVSPPTLRIYAWERPTVTIGYAQDVESSINVDYCLSKGIDIVRRITGGRGILHRGEFTYSIAAPNDIFFDDSMSGIYALIKDVLRDAFSSLGITVDVSSEKKRGIGGGACFGGAYRHELTIEGRKIMGGALRRLKESFLYHGSILLERDSEELARVLRFDSVEEEKKYIYSLNQGIIGINDILDKAIDRYNIENVLVGSFNKILGIKFYDGKIKDPEDEMISRLVSEKKELMSNIIAGKR